MENCSMVQAVLACSHAAELSVAGKGDMAMFKWLQALFAPATLPVATVMGRTYTVVAVLDQLKRGMDSEHPVLYRFNTAEYTDTLKQLADFMAATYGEQTPERDAVTGSPKLCSKCMAVFSETWGVPSAFGAREMCPNCGHDVAYIALDVFRPEDISKDDIEAIKAFYERQAATFWANAESEHVECPTGRACDGTRIERGQGYLRAGSLACERCIDEILGGCLDKLKEDPYYLGNDLWLSRMTTDPGADADVNLDDPKLKAAYREAQMQATMTVVAQEKMSGTSFSEEQRFNQIMSLTHNALREKGYPLSVEQFTHLMNNTSLVGD